MVQTHSFYQMVKDWLRQHYILSFCINNLCGIYNPGYYRFFFFYCCRFFQAILAERYNKIPAFDSEHCLGIVTRGILRTFVWLDIASDFVGLAFDPVRRCSAVVAFKSAVDKGNLPISGLRTRNSHYKNGQ